MGCDIHLRVEIKDNSGMWIDGNLYDSDKNILEFYNGRDYSLFGILAGVRDEHFLGAIADTRGMPADCLGEHRDYMTCIDFHSQTFFSFQELKQQLNKYNVTKHSGMISDNDNKMLIKYGEAPDSWCKSTSQDGYIKAEWYSNHNSLKNFIESFSVLCDVYWKQYAPDEIRVLIAFDN